MKNQFNLILQEWVTSNGPLIEYILDVLCLAAPALIYILCQTQQTPQQTPVLLQ